MPGVGACGAAAGTVAFEVEDTGSGIAPDGQSEQGLCPSLVAVIVGSRQKRRPNVRAVVV